MKLINDTAEAFFLWLPLCFVLIIIIWAIMAGIKIGIEILIDKIKASNKKG